MPCNINCLYFHEYCLPLIKLFSNFYITLICLYGQLYLFRLYYLQQLDNRDTVKYKSLSLIPLVHLKQKRKSLVKNFATIYGPLPSQSGFFLLILIQSIPFTVLLPSCMPLLYPWHIPTLPKSTSGRLKNTTNYSLRPFKGRIT